MSRSGALLSAGSGQEVGGRAWQANTAYKANDLVVQAGTLYRANADFTSGATFNAANWTAVTTGGGGVPAGGATGQVLKKNSGTDGDATWSPDLTGNAATIDARGTLGATSTVTLSATTDAWVTCTLGVDHAMTVTPVTGGKTMLFVRQDGTGNHKLTINDGSGAVSVPVNKAAGALTLLELRSTDGTNVSVNPEGVYSPRNSPSPRLRNLKALSTNAPEFGSSTVSIVAGKLYLIRIPIETAFTITTFVHALNAAGVTLTAGQNQIGVYSKAGVLLGRNSAMHTVWTAAVPPNEKRTTLTAEAGQSLFADDDVYAGILANGTTMPQFWGGGGTLAALDNFGLDATDGYVVASHPTTGLTDLPASITVSTLNIDSKAILVGLK